MNNGDTPTPKPNLTLSLVAEETPHDDAPKSNVKASRMDELLANSSLSLMPVEAASTSEDSSDESVVATDTSGHEPVETHPLETPSIADAEAAHDETSPIATADDDTPVTATALTASTNEPKDEDATQESEQKLITEAAPAPLEDIAVLAPTHDEFAANESDANDVTAASDPLRNAEHAITAVDLNDDSSQAERDKAIRAAENDAAALFGTATASDDENACTPLASDQPVLPASSASDDQAGVAPTADEPAREEEPSRAESASDHSAPNEPIADQPSPDEQATVETPVVSAAMVAAASAARLTIPKDEPVSGKAVFEAKPLAPKVPPVELDIPPPPLKKTEPPVAIIDAVAPLNEPAQERPPTPTPTATETPRERGGLFGKIGAWKNHLGYLHTLYKEDPTTAVSHWKQTYKERDALIDALKNLQQRQHADNFAWDEIPRVLEQFHLRDEDRGQADWYGDAERQYRAVLAAIEKQKTFKPALVQPLMKELKFIAEADEFHQKFGLTTVQQKVKTMYMTLQHRIDEYMKLQKQQLEIAVKDKEIEKLRAQEAIATAEAQKVAQENRLVQEQRLKVVEDKKRLEAKRAAEEAERVRIERQREIEAEQAEVRRREELSASFRAIEQEELMKKAVQNMSLNHCAEGLLRQLFEKDHLTEQERAAASRVLDVLKAKLG